jgi:hypothetical protein
VTVAWLAVTAKDMSKDQVAASSPFGIDIIFVSRAPFVDGELQNGAQLVEERYESGVRQCADACLRVDTSCP